MNISDYPVQINSYHDDRDLKEIFISLKNYYLKNYPEIANSLNKPASLSDLVDFQKKLGIELPADFKELYQLANGQVEGEHPFFYNGFNFIDLNTSISYWQMLKKEYDKTFVDNEILNIKEAIVFTWWHPKWIPIGVSMNGDLLCIDLSPGQKGKLGQVIEFIHDDAVRYHLGFSIKDFIGDLDTGLRTGKYFMHPEYLIITGHEDS